MNFKKFQLTEKIQTLIDSGQANVLLECIDTIKSAYNSGNDLAEKTALGYDIIGFKGTSSIPDLITDLKYTKSDEFHSGFKHKAGIITANWKLAERLKDKSNIIFTGHSMGAAVALFNFIHFRLDKELGLANKIKMLVCLGMPRVGSIEFLDKKLQEALAVDPRLDSAKALHFIILKEGEHQDVVTTIPNTLHPPHSDLLDFVDYSALTPASKTSKLLGIHLHRLDAYRESLERLIAETR